MTNENADRHQGINPNLLFWASCVALIATAMSFAIRGDIATAFETKFALDKDQLGGINAAAFWSFGLLILFGGPLVDLLGMRRMLFVAAACHLGGTVLTIFAPSYTVLWLATFIVGAGNGLVEAVCNPLVATIYPEEKAHKLTTFHAWFPGGIVIGGLLCFGLTTIGTAPAAGATAVPLLAGIELWKIKMGLLLIPMVVYLVMILNQKFPATERVEAGVSFSEMFAEVLRRPIFWVVFLMMWLTASTELVPGFFVRNVYDDMMGAGSGAGILFLVWGTGLMWFLRQFCSKAAHSMSPILLIAITAPLAAAGLAMFPMVGESKALFFLAATLLFVGVCFWWPTMLAIVNERSPKTGALGMAIIGAAGSFSTAIFSGVFGKVSEGYQTSLAEGGMVQEMVTKVAPVSALRVWALLPVIVCIVFLVVFLKDLAAGGYKAEKLGASD